MLPKATTAGERAQEGRHGKDILDQCPMWTRENFGLLDDDDEDADDEGVSPTPKEKSMNWDATALSATLDKLDEQLNGLTPSALQKGLAHVEDGLDDLGTRQRSQDQELAYLRAQNARLAREIAELREEQAYTRHAAEASTTGLKTIRKGLRQQWREEHEAPPAEPSALTKAVASFLPTDATRAQAERTALWVMKSFGAKGGQVVKYDRDLASKLVLTKSISPEENQNLKTYGRLPDGVGLGTSTGRAQDTQSRSLTMQHWLASSGVPALLCPPSLLGGQQH
jgi:hypothetical protein